MILKPAKGLNKIIDRVELINSILYQTPNFKIKNYMVPYEVKYKGALDDDPDVMGDSYRLFYNFKLLSKSYKIPVVDFHFYHDKSYKNRRVYLWQEDQDADQELSFLEKLVMNNLRASLKKQLKKRSLV